MRIYYDLESTGLMNSESIDYSSVPYKLKPSFRIHCIVAKDADTGEVYRFYQDNLNEAKEFFEEVTEVIGHNIINYDDLVLRLYFGLHFKVGYDGQETLNGRPCKITDTLVLSRLLNPDRKGGHSLKAWGLRLGILKGDFSEETDWKEFSEEMLKYCEQDVEVTEATYKALCKEWGNWPWDDAYKLEKQVQYITTNQEHFGFSFNKELAENCLVELDQWLEEIEAKVEPQLPEKKISKTNAKQYVPPKIQFKKNGEPSANLEKFIEKHGGRWIGKRQVELFGQSYDLPLPQEPLVDKEPMTLANQIELKQWLVSAGWEPLVFGEKDLTLDSKKQKLSQQKFKEAAKRYLDDTLGGPYEKYRCERLRCKPWELQKRLLTHDTRKPLKVYTSPKYTINQDKEVDPNLIKMGEKYAFIEDVVKWLTYRHRRNSILSPKGTGFLKHIREDGRIPTPANSCGASTSRYQHNVVCNIPRVTSLYGDKMRDMFGAEGSNYQIGYDFSGLEARIEGHYTIQFEGGDEYAKDLIAEKPNDIHCYSEDTEILTKTGWKTFGALVGEDKVAQWSEGRGIEFVKPLEVVWQDYEGEMVHVATNTVDQLITPNHRVLIQSYCTKKYSVQEAKDLYNESSSNRIPTGGFYRGEKTADENVLRLAVATQADGYLEKDSSAIRFTFVREDKIQRMLNMLEKIGGDYTKNTFKRKGRTETTVRVKAGSLAKEVRGFLNSDKSLSEKTLHLDLVSREAILDEISYWDGTKTKGGQIVLDLKCERTIKTLQTICHLSGRTCNVKKYYRKTGYSEGYFWRLYLSNKGKQWGSIYKSISTTEYKGKIGCVVVPSSFVVVKRDNKICISGNTKHAKMNGITRDEQKTLKYSCTYGAQPPKIAKQMGWQQKRAKDVFESFWESAKPLAILKERVVRYWKQKGGMKFVKAIDGRKLWVRSEHSIVNIVFQSAGVICAKRANVIHHKWLEERGLLFDPFADDSFEGKCHIQIHYHDEAQWEVDKSLVMGDTSVVGDLASKASKEAGNYYKLRVNLDADYEIGKSWKDCH